MKLLSEFINELQNMLDNHGDAEIYRLGDCLEHEIPFVLPNYNSDFKIDSYQLYEKY